MLFEAFTSSLVLTRDVRSSPRMVSTCSITAARSCLAALRQGVLFVASGFAAAFPVVLVVGSFMGGIVLGFMGSVATVAISRSGDVMRMAFSAGGMAESEVSGIQMYLRSPATPVSGESLPYKHNSLRPSLTAFCK